MVQKVVFGQGLRDGLKRNTVESLRSPGRFLFGRPYATMWTLYAATYVVSNLSHTFTSVFNEALVGTVTFINTSLVNVPLGILKDIRFAQIFGAPPPTTLKKDNSINKVVAPNPSRGSFLVAASTFLVRDCITIFGSFTMAPALSGSIPDSIASTHRGKAIISQLTVPAISQLVATPIHLLGLDQHARPHGISWQSRARQIRKDVIPATFVRSLRIIPAFGIGNILNMEARQRLRFEE